MTRARLLVSVVFVACLVGCKKKSDLEGGSGDDAAAGTPAGQTSSASEWVVVSDVAVRILKVRVEKPVIEERDTITSTQWKEHELNEPELMVWVQIENRSATKKLDYAGWFFFDGDPLVDEHGNRYAPQSHDKITRRLKGRAKSGAINPGDKSVTDVLCFQRPVGAATKLTLTLPSLTPKEKPPGQFRFEIPVKAWTGSGKAIPAGNAEHEPPHSPPPPRIEPKPEPKAEEKFAGLNEWSRVGDVQVRITKGKVMIVPLKTLTGREYVSKEPQLVLVIEVQNLSPVKKLDYHRWDAGPFHDVSINDEHGNKYSLRYRDEFSTDTRYKIIQPGGPVHQDMLCVEQPVAPATELKLTFPALVIGEKEKYRFKIPSSAWK